MSLENTNAMTNFATIYESSLSSIDFESGTVYFCSDSGNIYFDDPVTQERTSIGNQIKMLATETDRKNLLTKSSDYIYIVIETGRIYIYSSEWINIGGGNEAFASNVVVSDGTLTISDSRITEFHNATFIPDFTIADLCGDITTSCTTGSCTITVDSTYDIPGIIYFS